MFGPVFGIGAGLSEVDPQSGGRARDRDARRMRTVASRECSECSEPAAVALLGVRK